MKIKAAPGRNPRDPISMATLPPEGREVRDTDPFWRRRLRDADVEIVDDVEIPPPPDDQRRNREIAT